MHNCDYQFEKADKELFAAYQAIYSQEDRELWSDWTARLDDTREWDDGHVFLCDGIKNRRSNNTAKSGDISVFSCSI